MTDLPGCAAPGCRHPGAPMLCPGHEAKLGEWLADIAGLYAALDATLSTATDWTLPEHASLTSERAPARLDVLVLRDPRSRERDPDDPDGNGGRGVLEVLGSWARVVREERNLPSVSLNVRSARETLATHLNWIVEQPWVDELYADVRAVWALLQAANGNHAPRPQARHDWPDSDGNTCGGPIWVDNRTAWCGDCRASWTGLELIELWKLTGVEVAA